MQTARGMAWSVRVGSGQAGVVIVTACEQVNRYVCGSNALGSSLHPPFTAISL